MSVTRKHLVRKLPRDYFGDCQLSAAPENLGRSEQSGAESREGSGESGATAHFGATATASSGWSQAQQAHAPADTLAVAPSSSAVVGTSADGVHGAGGVMPSSAAGNASQLPLFSGPASIRFTTKDQAGDTHVLTIDKVQLHAARVISGRAQG